jgi:hypothetical protein
VIDTKPVGRKSSRCKNPTWTSITLSLVRKNGSKCHIQRPCSSDSNSKIIILEKTPENARLHVHTVPVPQYLRTCCTYVLYLRTLYVHALYVHTVHTTVRNPVRQICLALSAPSSSSSGSDPSIRFFWPIGDVLLSFLCRREGAAPASAGWQT